MSFVAERVFTMPGVQHLALVKREVRSALWPRWSRSCSGLADALDQRWTGCVCVGLSRLERGGLVIVEIWME